MPINSKSLSLRTGLRQRSSLMRVRPRQNTLGIQTHAESRPVRHFHSTIDWYGLVQKQRREHWDHLISARRHHQKLGKGTVMSRDDKMIAVDARPVRHYERLMGVGQGRDLDEFRETPAPTHIRLQNVTASHVKQQSKSPARRFVFTCGDQHSLRNATTQIRITPVVIRRKRLL